VTDLDRDLRSLRALLEVLVRLRAPDGCPWDRVQTVSSLAPYLLEEVFEAFEAIAARHAPETTEELGDCLMNVLLLALAAETDGTGSVADVADGIARKLVRRHPHVFGKTEVAGVADVWSNWEKIKAAEKGPREDGSAIAGVPLSLPALLRALRVVEKASRAGFRYPDEMGAVAKVDEEWSELRAEIARGDAVRIEEELGDSLLALVVVAQHAGVDPEMALRRGIDRFSKRFRSVEKALGPRMKDAPLEELAAEWTRAKNFG